MLFYRIGTDSLRMVYVNFHKSICLRDFSGRGGGVRGSGGVSFVAELLRYSWSIPTPFYRIDKHSLIFINLSALGTSLRRVRESGRRISFVAKLLRDRLKISNIPYLDGIR